MSYLVFCTFDLKNATAKDYENAYADLAKIGLNKVVKADNGSNIVVPTTSTMGFFDGSGAISVRDDVNKKVRSAFGARRFSSEIFIVVGGDWGWLASTT